jgi:hypothetical protein
LQGGNDNGIVAENGSRNFIHPHRRVRDRVFDRNTYPNTRARACPGNADRE